MAELSIDDRRAIHGDNFEAVEARAQMLMREPDGPEERRRALAARMEKNETGRISAFALALTGTFLALGSWYRTGGMDIAGMIGLAAVAGAIVWYVWLVSNAKTWRQKLAN